MGVFSDSVANGWLNALARNTAYQVAAVYAQLHTGDPGAAGTSNVATENTRKQVTFGDAAASRAISNTAVVEWTNVAATETYTHVSFWSGSSGGTYLGKDDLSSPAAVTAGDTFRLPVGDVDLSIT